MSDLLWPAVAAFSMWTARQLFGQWLAHTMALKAVADDDRIKRLENEVKGLIQVQNMKGLGR